MLDAVLFVEVERAGHPILVCADVDTRRGGRKAEIAIGQVNEQGIGCEVSRAGDRGECAAEGDIRFFLFNPVVSARAGFVVVNDGIVKRPSCNDTTAVRNGSVRDNRATLDGSRGFDPTSVCCVVVFDQAIPQDTVRRFRIKGTSLNTGDVEPEMTTPHGPQIGSGIKESISGNSTSTSRMGDVALDDAVLHDRGA